MRILVVDDEQDLCEILRFNLEAEGFGVDIATSAEEAMPMAAAGGYNLMLLDVMMDRVSGFDMAERLRQNGVDTPVIFLTALGGHDDQMRGFDVGADDYITKPFSFDTVLARIRAVLRRTGSHADRQNAQTAPAIPDNLTRREYLILQLLTEHPGRYFTREEIVDAVWPDDACVGERSVDVHIARMRKKLGAEGSRIVNKTGFGYGLV